MKPWEEFLFDRLPLTVYREISRDMVDIFQAAYRDYPPAQEHFKSVSHAELREEIHNSANSAKEYDPHESVHNVLGSVRTLAKLLTALIALLFLLSSALGIGYTMYASQQAIGIIYTPTGLLIQLVSLLGSVPAALALLYIYLLSFNTAIVQALNTNLVITGGRVQTRSKENLAAIYLWNSSLDGGSGLTLLAIFSILWAISAVTGRAAYSTVKRQVINNIGLLSTTDGFVDATRIVYREMRNTTAE